MGITRLASAPGLPTNFPFSLAGAADGVCLISGMPSVDADGAFAPGTFEQETERAWRNVVSIAEAAGYSAQDILYVQCVLAEIGDYSALNDWWRRQFPDVATAPARFTFQAGALPFGAKVELQAVAGR
ncbi:MAG TPA: RidA family protein [Solirubrobacteraceae bacterium]|jgi:2-iminobutanoate/2-iminopropanoate deaminase|nr:RidA family protein [Solirubrobacteraceae bacterium]